MNKNKCSPAEAYRRENNRVCPYCGNDTHCNSLVHRIIIKKHGLYKSYHLEMTCSKCGKKYITEGNKVKL